MKCKFFVVYLEHIMIHSSVMAEYIIHVQDVLILLTEDGHKAKQAKCALACQKVNFCVVLATVPFLDRFYYSGSNKTRPQLVRSGFVPNGSLN
jgi:hypothetical protein